MAMSAKNLGLNKINELPNYSVWLQVIVHVDVNHNLERLHKKNICLSEVKFQSLFRFQEVH